MLLKNNHDLYEHNKYIYFFNKTLINYLIAEHNILFRKNINCCLCGIPLDKPHKLKSIYDIQKNLYLLIYNKQVRPIQTLDSLFSDNNKITKLTSWLTYTECVIPLYVTNIDHTSNECFKEIN